MNARVLIIAFAAGGVATLVVAGAMLLLVLALFVSASSQFPADAMLPESELSEPPETDDEKTVSVYVTRTGTVLIGESELSVDDAPSLILEQLEQLDEGQSVAKYTVVIRVEADALPGTVQELIMAFQARGFERFKLQVAEENYGSSAADPRTDAGPGR